VEGSFKMDLKNLKTKSLPGKPIKICGAKMSWKEITVYQFFICMQKYHEDSLHPQLDRFGYS
jgi:hypothetical protein